MLTQSPILTAKATKWLLLFGCLVAFFVLLPSIALADPPNPAETDPNKCAVCHQAEAEDWQNSPHAQAMTPLSHGDAMACEEGQEETCTCLTCHTTNFDTAAKTFSQAGVTCEACHGPYVEGHPENGQMKLDVDSSICSDCHQETHKDWLSTPHAAAGVQCIGCHKSHSQNLRLDDEQLCTSCHRDRLTDPGHAQHIRAGLNCIDCHATPTATTVDSGARMGGSAAPSHQFAVATEVCANCHGAGFHDTASMAVTDQNADAARAAMVEAASQQQPAEEIVAAEADRRWLQGATIFSFGMGMGFGALAGIIFVLIVGLIVQQTRRAKP